MEMKLHSERPWLWDGRHHQSCVVGVPGQVLRSLVLPLGAAAASWHLVSFCKTVIISSLGARMYVCMHVKMCAHTIEHVTGQPWASGLAFYSA